MNKDQGWIKLYRSIKNNWIFDNPEYFRAWIIILLKVNYEEKKTIIQGELIICKRGQSLISLDKWRKEFGKWWTIQKVRTFFKLLQNEKMIDVEGLRKTTRLTVCNYDSYQHEEQTDNTQITNKEQTDNTQITTTKERKEIIKNEKEILFNKFWELYDKKNDRKKTYLKFIKLSISEINEILEYLPRYILNTPDIKFRKNPITFLNSEIWKDEVKNEQNGIPPFDEAKYITNDLSYQPVLKIARDAEYKKYCKQYGI